MLDMLLAAIGKMAGGSMPFSLGGPGDATAASSVPAQGTADAPGSAAQFSFGGGQKQGGGAGIPAAPAMPAAPDPRRQVSLDGLLAAINKRPRLGV